MIEVLRPVNVYSVTCAYMRCPIFAGQWHALFLDLILSICVGASSLHALYTRYFTWGLLGDNGLDVNWQLARSHTAKTQYRKFETKIPRKGTARP
jgi:hypothetical protein